MSTPTRKVRQPGRTAQGHNKPDCGVCNNGAPGPIGLVVNGLNRTGSCCIEGFDNGGTAMPLTADTGNCARSNGATGPHYCSYTYPMTFAGSNFQWSVTIECVSDGSGGYHVHVGVSLDEILTGGALHNIAYGDWYSSSFASCGDFDCTFPSGAPSGTLTVTDVGGSWCTPGNCGSPSWGLNTGNVNPCPQPAALNCCCGGQPPPPCYYVCFKQRTGSVCCFAFQDMPLCYDSAAGCYTGDSRPGSCSSSVQGSLCYTPSGGWEFTWSCGGSSQSTSLSAAHSGGALSFSASGLTDTTGCCASGSTFDINIGKSAPCIGEHRPITDPTCGGCSPDTYPQEMLVTLPNATITGPLDPSCQITGLMGGDYFVEWYTPCSYQLYFPSVDTCCSAAACDTCSHLQFFTDPPQFPGDTYKLTVKFVTGGAGVTCYSFIWQLESATPFDCCNLDVDVPYLSTTAPECSACFSGASMAAPCHIKSGGC